MQRPFHSFAVHRQCRYCNRALEPETVRSWRMNGLLPLGSTARYECAPCQHSFNIRSNFHVAVLAVGLAVLISAIESLQSRSVFAQAVVYSVMFYMAFALAKNAWNRQKNPAVADRI